MIVRNIQTECTHCGLPVPAGLLDAKRDEQFCCNGCTAAWTLIHGSGLDSFYRMVENRTDLQPSQNLNANGGTNSLADFDDPSFLDTFARRDHNGTSIKLLLDGIHCAACVWLIEKLPTVVPGVSSAHVNWAKQTVFIRWSPELVRLSKIASALHQLGYTPHPIRENRTAIHRNNENRRQLIQIGFAAAAAGNNMIIAVALYFGMFSYMSANMETLLRIASCVVGMASFLGPGRVFLRGAINALKTRTAHMDLPIATGLTVGSIAGLINTVSGTGEIYFDSLSVLICLLLIGRWIQFRQQNRAADAVDMLYRLTPQKARKVVEDNIVEVAVDDLNENDLIQVRPGDLIAADGIIIEGRSLVDESILTGESVAVGKIVGDQVSAGTKNSSSVLQVKVTATGQQTRISNILELVEQATSEKPAIVQWADQIGGYFVVLVLFLAALTFAGWWFVDAGRAVDRAVALLIVACPCALAMATPLAIAVALGRLANRKILVKSGDVLQSLNRPGVFWLDKTGTLTVGKMSVAQWKGDKKWLPAIAQIESKFCHPVATAFVEFSFDENEIDFEIENIESQNGGVFARLDGQPFLIGNRKLLESHGVLLDCRDWGQFEANLIANQHSPCWVAFKGEVVGLAGIGDTIRKEAKFVVEKLQQQGWQVGILSGDHHSIVASAADQLGIETFHAAVSPEDKLAIVSESDHSFATTVMVGDGVNDSAALAAATVGIAVKGGAEASLAAAPVYFGAAGLASIQELLNASRSTTRTIRTNIAVSLGYNILGVSLAIIGWLNPLVAAILMPISSLTVLSLSVNAARKP